MICENRKIRNRFELLSHLLLAHQLNEVRLARPSFPTSQHGMDSFFNYYFDSTIPKMKTEASNYKPFVKIMLMQWIAALINCIEMQLIIFNILGNKCSQKHSSAAYRFYTWYYMLAYRHATDLYGCFAYKQQNHTAVARAHTHTQHPQTQSNAKLCFCERLLGNHSTKLSCNRNLYWF